MEHIGITITENDIWTWLDKEIYQKIKDKSSVHAKNCKEMFDMKSGKKNFKKISFKQDAILSQHWTNLDLCDVDRKGFIHRYSYPLKYPFGSIFLPIETIEFGSGGYSNGGWRNSGCLFFKVKDWKDQYFTKKEFTLLKNKLYL